MTFKVGHQINKGKHSSTRTEFKRGQVAWNKGKRGLYKASEVTRKKMGDAHRGAKSHFWQGGLTPINAKIRNSLEYSFWREAVFKRDNYVCVLCGTKSEIGKRVRLNVS